MLACWRHRVSCVSACAGVSLRNLPARVLHRLWRVRTHNHALLSRLRVITGNATAPIRLLTSTWPSPDLCTHSWHQLRPALTSRVRSLIQSQHCITSNGNSLNKHCSSDSPTYLPIQYSTLLYRTKKHFVYFHRKLRVIFSKLRTCWLVFCFVFFIFVFIVRPSSWPFRLKSAFTGIRSCL